MLMVDGEKQYTIQFYYRDNQELYEDRVFLSKEEFERVKAFLQSLLGHNEIYLPNPGWQDQAIYETRAVHVSSFKDMLWRWEHGSLISMGKKHGLRL
jgi:hypothetical protein